MLLKVSSENLSQWINEDLMDFVINDNELAVLCGLPHIQQLAYLRGIRPYMDVKTGLVGIKRRISYQSISEQLYVEPHQGIKSQSFSRDQIRRAVSSLVRSGLIAVQSEGMQLILKCELATRNYFVQNKAAINPPQKATTNPHEKNLVNTGLPGISPLKSDIAQLPKAATPLKEENYIYLLSQFEQFWDLYPEKKSRSSAWQAFQLINPNQTLLNTMLRALIAEIKNREEKQLYGLWVPPWKHPANWLAKQCWEDELSMNKLPESKRATHNKTTGNQLTEDMFWKPGEPEDECPSNVISFRRFQE